MPKVLIVDNLHPRAEELLNQKGIDAVQKPTMLIDDLISEIEREKYNGLIVRGTTQVKESRLLDLPSLQVVGRAGAGVNNIYVEAAAEKGVQVLNAPGANADSVAELVVGNMVSLARFVTAANASTQKGLSEKKKFSNGTQIRGKTIGIVGLGNIGQAVVNYTVGFRMPVVAYDPYIQEDRKATIEKENPRIRFVELNELIARSDVITLHTPAQDRQILDEASFGQMKDGVYIINCARTGLIDKPALREAMLSKKVAGAALDVFPNDFNKDKKHFSGLNMILTPHIGASTKEAQIAVAEMIAGGVGDYLLTGQVRHPVNTPAVHKNQVGALALVN